ncbi:D-ribose pyranase [Paenibacillus sp. TH7-28]
MKRNGILNRGLNEVLAAMGHGQILIVCDAGFPIPAHVRCIDLSITKDIPDLETVLKAITSEFITEKVIYGQQIQDYNAPLYKELQRLFSDCEHEIIPHEEIIEEIAHRAVAVVRTGAYNPWGNIALVSGTDPFAWYTNKEVQIPEAYQQRKEAIIAANQRDKYYSE